MNDYITLKDNDLISMNDTTGDVVILAAHLPENISTNSPLRVHYEEDSDNVFHEYLISNIDYDSQLVELTWVKQLGESLLTEGPNDLYKRVSKQMKKTHKANLKDEKNISKVIARDMSPEGRDWKFYFPDASGKYGKPVSQEDAKEKYEDMGNNLSPEVANAIVVTPTGYIVRKGTKDLYRKGFRFNEKELNNTSTQMQGEPEDPKSDANTKQPGRYDLGISSNTYSHFLKLLYVMRPNIYDAMGKQIDVSNIKSIGDNIKYNNLLDYEIEIDGQKVPAVKWIQTAVKNKVLMEETLTEAPVIKLNSDELMNPDDIDFKGKVLKAVEQERAAAEIAQREQHAQKLRNKYSSVAEKLKASLNRGDPTEYVINHIFDDLVPSSGPAETTAGELVRAITRILYRDSNDGDKFFEGYGLETCGSSAEYLFDKGLDTDIQNILDQAVMLSEDDDKYTDAIQLLAQHVLEHIDSNPTLLWTENTEDSREYASSYIEENQPTYEFELYGSDAVDILIDKGVLDSWDLIRYVEEQLEWEPAYRDAEVARPWSHHDKSVTVTDLTRDGYDLLESNFNHNPEGWWEDLTSKYSNELSDSDYDDDYSEDGSYEDKE